MLTGDNRAKIGLTLALAAVVAAGAGAGVAAAQEPNPAQPPAATTEPALSTEPTPPTEPAGPEPEPLGDVPALDEYIEDVPTAVGPKATARPEPTKRGDPTARRKVPTRVERALRTQPRPVARKLRRIVRSPHYGVSEREASPSSQRAARRLLRNESDAEQSPPASEALGTAVSAATTGGDWHLTVLLVLVLLTTAGAIGVAASRVLAGRVSR